DAAEVALHRQAVHASLVPAIVEREDSPAQVAASAIGLARLHHERLIVAGVDRRRKVDRTTRQRQLRPRSSATRAVLDDEEVGPDATGAQRDEGPEGGVRLQQTPILHHRSLAAVEAGEPDTEEGIAAQAPQGRAAVVVVQDLAVGPTVVKGIA